MTDLKAGEWVSVYCAPDAWRGELAAGWLREAGIPTVLRSNAIPGYGFTGPAANCWGEVMVPYDLQAEARRTLNDALPDEPAEG